MLEPKVSANSERLYQNMIFAATEAGIATVQEIAAMNLKAKPGMTLKAFTQVLDTYMSRAKLAVRNPSK